MIEIALALFKRFAPIIAVVLILGATWAHGYVTADKSRIEQIAQINAESDALLKQATAANLEKAKKIDDAAKHIEETNHANRQVIESIADHNRALAVRVQQSAGRCVCAVPTNTKPAESRDGTIAGAGEFWTRAVESARHADEVTEVARACQNYVKSLEILK